MSQRAPLTDMGRGPNVSGVGRFLRHPGAGYSVRHP